MNFLLINTFNTKKYLFIKKNIFLTHFLASYNDLGLRLYLNFHTSEHFLLLPPSPLFPNYFLDISNSSQTLEK